MLGFRNSYVRTTTEHVKHAHESARKCNRMEHSYSNIYKWRLKMLWKP